MVKPVRRAALSRQQRDERIEAVRRDLDAFLNTLDPLLRKYLLDPESLTLPEWNEIWIRATPERKGQRDEALQHYERLLIQIPDEWRRHCRRQMPQYKLIKEWILLGRVARRGAPRKAPEEREPTIVARLVADAEECLGTGCELRHRRKQAGGAASDDSEIETELKALGYDRDACCAILESRQPRSAAIRLVARQLQKEPASIKSALRRAKPR